MTILYYTNESNLVLEDKEDFGLLQLMNEADRSKKVDREAVMKFLELRYTTKQDYNKSKYRF